jgi:hypothetical protein
MGNRMKATFSCHCLAIVLGLALLAASCASPWTVRQQAQPNPLVGQKKFAYQPMVFEGMSVGNGSEQDHLADKDAEQRAAWESDKKQVAAGFLSGIQSEVGSALSVRPSEGDYKLEPHVEVMEPGTFTGVFNLPAILSCVVRILDAQGKLVDEIAVTGQAYSTVFDPTVTQRMMNSARIAGIHFGKYLEERTEKD